jgi:hypothetical protein
MKLGTIQDLLDMKNGHLSKGFLRHEGCGGQICYSHSMDRYTCSGGCKENPAWKWAWVHDRKIDEDKSGQPQWTPPVYKDGF